MQPLRPPEDVLTGMRQMGLDDVFDALGYLTRDPRARQAVEWLGCTWGHAVAPSTPPQDFRLHVRAWQHHFAAVFGLEALGRVGISPAEMALPNHPDVACAFVRTLADCGYQWVLVQEHTVEQPGGRGVEHPHLPHRLVCTDSRGNTASILAVVKTQGSDTKLVGQMQPYYEARSLHPAELAGRPVAPLVTQIADGENGGVMMNEFPPKYFEVIRECSGSHTPTVNVTAYLYFRVADPIKATVNVQNYPLAVSQQAQTSLRSIIGQSEMDQLLAERELGQPRARRIIDEPTEGPWGIRVERVEIKDVSLPDTSGHTCTRTVRVVAAGRCRSGARWL